MSVELRKSHWQKVAEDVFPFGYQETDGSTRSISEPVLLYQALSQAIGNLTGSDPADTYASMYQAYKEDVQANRSDRLDEMVEVLFNLHVEHVEQLITSEE